MARREVVGSVTPKMFSTLACEKGPCTNFKQNAQEAVMEGEGFERNSKTEANA